jgi:hypothetical protein
MAGVVHQDIDAAIRGQRAVEHAGHGSRVADIGLGADGAPASGFYLARQLFGLRGLAGVIDDDRRAVRGEALGNRRPDAPRGAGHDRDLSVQLVHFVLR